MNDKPVANWRIRAAEDRVAELEKFATRMEAEYRERIAIAWSRVDAARDELKRLRDDL